MWQQLQQTGSQLEQQQSHLSHALSTIQRQDDDLDARLVSQLKQHQKLAHATKKLSTKLRDLEENASLTERNSGELEQRTNDLERNATEISGKQQQLEELSRQLNERIEPLASLQVDSRLDDLNRSGDALEQSLKGEQERIEALTHASESLKDQLNLAIDNTGALEERIATLSNRDDQLGREIEALQAELQGRGAPHQEQLQAQESQLVKQQELIASTVAEQIRANDGINNRLGTLDVDHQSVAERTDTLRAQQAEQGAEADKLQQRLRQRTIQGIVIFLLVTAALGFLQFQNYKYTDALLQTVVVEPTVKSETTVDAMELQGKIAELRNEFIQLSASVTQVTESVDKISTGVDPELPGQVSGLTETTETLTQESLQQQQQSARLQESQEQMQTAVKEIASEVKSLEEQLSQYPAATVAIQSPEGKQWLKAQQLGLYTLQMLGVHKRESLARFIRQQGIEADSAIYHTQRQGQKWYVLFYGTYESITEARNAAKSLPRALADQKPWVRKIPKTGGLFPLEPVRE